MAIELATGYVSLVPSAKGIKSKIERELGGIPSIASSVGAKASRGFGAKFSAGLKSIGKPILSTLGKLAKGGGVAAALFGGAALKLGYDRLTTIENATAKLTHTLGSASKAAKFTNAIVKTVNGTPFNLDQFLDAGSSLVQMGISAKKVPGYLTSIGNVAATKGKQANNFAARLTDTFAQAAAQGRITGETIQQMIPAGVNAIGILANGFGVSTDKMRKMVSAGLVPAKKGLDILSKGIGHGSNGVNGRIVGFGGQMKALRKTTTGAAGGFKSAMARIGAAVLKPALPLLAKGATKGADALDGITAKVGPFIAKFTKLPAVVSTFNRFKTALSGNVFKKFGDVLKPIGAALGTMAAKITPMLPKFVKIAKSIGTTLFNAAKKLAPVIASLFANVVPKIAKVARIFGTVLAGALRVVVPLVVKIATKGAELIKKIPVPAIVAIVSALVAFKTIKAGASAINGMGTKVDNLKKSFAAGKKVFTDAKANLTRFGSAAKGVGTKIGGAAKALANGAKAAGKFAKQGLVSAANWAKATAVTVANKVAQIAQAVATKLAAAAQWLWNAAMDANPITLIVIAIAALAAGVVLAYQKVGWFRAAVQAVARFFTATLWPLLKTFAGWISTAFKATIHGIGSAFTAVKNVISGAVTAVVGFVTGIPHRIGAVVSTLWNGLKSGITAARDWIRGKITAVVGFVTGIPHRIAHTVSTMWNGLKSGMTSAKDWISKKVDAVVGFFTGMPKRMANTFSGLFNGIKNGFKSAINWVIDKWNGFHLPKVKVPHTSISIGGYGLPHINRLTMHTGGVVPGGPSYEPIVQLQGGEVVLSRDQVRAMGVAPQPAPQRHGPLFGDVILTNGTDIDTLLQKTGFALAGGRL